ncbi:MAG: enoyl-CoA hydratase/isomerase family protein [Dehalococcoidia bacterium]
MSTELVHLAVADGIATITLDSPNNRNALSRQLTGELWGHLQTALGDDGVRVIVLTGSGTVFCSGADLKEQREANEAGSGQLGPVGVPQILMAMWQSPKPIIGRINGPARAGGLGLVAACDISVAVETATFALSEVRIGVIPAVIAVVLLPKLGLAKAMELFITGEPFSAADAVAFGITNASAPTQDLDAAVQRYVAMLRKGAPGAVAGAKRLVRDVPGMPMAEAFERMAELSARYFASDEAREGMTAFAEKRPPMWAEGAD